MIHITLGLKKPYISQISDLSPRKKSPQPQDSSNNYGHNPSLEPRHLAFNALHQSFQGENRGLAPKSTTTILLSFDCLYYITLL